MFLFTTILTLSTQKENNELGNLKEIANYSLETGAKTEDSLLKDLQNSTDLKTSYKKIAGDIESHQIKEVINKFDMEIGKSGEPMEIVEILAKKDVYYSNVETGLKYPAYIDKNISDAIVVARNNQQENRLDSLNKIVSFLINEKLYNNTEIVRHLKEGKDLTEIVTTLTKNYQSRYIRNIEQNLGLIEKQGEVIIDDKRFDCPVKYLEQAVEYSNAEYTPLKEVAKIQEQTIAKQLELKQLAENAKKEQEQQAEKGMDFEEVKL